MKGEKSHSWYVSIKDILLKYSLPSPWELSDSPPTKFARKRQVTKSVDTYWSSVIKSRAALYSSLRCLNAETYKPGNCHPIIQKANGVKDVPRIHTKIKVLTSTYILQVNRASFNQNQISPVCLLCKEDDETTEHFLLQYSSLDSTRQPILDDILHTCENLDIKVSRDSDHLLQLILDCTAVLAESNPELKMNDYQQIERQTRRLCHALHIERYKKLPQIVPKRIRHSKQKGGRSTNSQNV